ncbi:MAG: hypothetical protein BGO97_12995 [Micrococcales bacterium 70-64]|nr:MAG: hypothetical protein ABT06_12995 [Leifsonia sp. SCN 70-46]OJX86549.1 MAG: hypothetical protein BGO97_12995 [Micrococcales bacterium 70-64]
MVLFSSWSFISAGVLLVILATIDLILTWVAEAAVRKAAKAAAQKSVTVDGDRVALAEFGDGFGKTVDAIAKLAGALKDLDRSTRLYVLAVTFFALSGVIESIAAITAAVK